MSEQMSAGESGSGTPAGGGSPTATATLESSSPSTTTSASVGTEPQGPVPYDRFHEVNTKYTTLKWAEGLDSHRVQQQQQFFQWLDADPEGAFKYMEDYLTRAGALKRQTQQAAKDDRPQPDVVVPETGQKFYSADAAEKLAAWQAKQATQPLDQRLQGIEQSFSQQRTAAAAQALMAEAQSWPHFTEHQAEILSAMEKDHRLSLDGAYNRVVVPKLRQLERQAVLAELNQKSQASTVNPASHTASQSRPAGKQSWTDLFRREMAKRGGSV